MKELGQALLNVDFFFMECKPVLHHRFLYPPTPLPPKCCCVSCVSFVALIFSNYHGVSSIFTTYHSSLDSEEIQLGHCLWRTNWNRWWNVLCRTCWWWTRCLPCSSWHWLGSHHHWCQDLWRHEGCRRWWHWDPPQVRACMRNMIFTKYDA